MKYLLISILAFCSCHVLKTSSSKDSSLNKVSTADSGHVAKAITNSTNEQEWMRLILQYAPAKKGDTNVYNNYYTMPGAAKPQVVIYETGKGKNNTVTNSYDSGFNKKFDQLQTLVTEMAKQKETKVLSFWDMVGIAFGCAILVIILAKFFKL